MYAVSHSWYVFHSLKWDELCLVYVKLSHFLVETSHIELTYNAKHCKRYHNYLLKRILSLKWSHHQTTCTGLFSFVISVNINFRIREVCIPHTWKVTSLEMYLTASLCGSHSVTPHPHDLIWRDKPFVWRYSPMNSSRLSCHMGIKEKGEFLRGKKTSGESGKLNIIKWVHTFMEWPILYIHWNLQLKLFLGLKVACT